MIGYQDNNPDNDDMPYKELPMCLNNVDDLTPNL